MPDLDDLLNHASDELATMPVPDRPFVPRPRRVGPALVVVALLAGAGGLTAVVRSQSTSDHVLVANTPITTATSTVQTSNDSAATAVTEPPVTATPQTSVMPASTTPVPTTSDPLPFTQPQQVISGTTGGLAWTLDVSTEEGGIRCLRFTAEATSRTFCLSPIPDELVGMSFVVRTRHLMAAIGQALPSEIKGPITAARSTVTPVTGLTADGTMFMAAVTLATDPIVQLPSGEECDYAGILDSIEAAGAAEGYQPTHLLNVAIDHCRGDIAAGSSRAAEPSAAQTAFRIFNRSGTTWLASAADHMNSCLDTESGTPPCVKLGYSKPAATGTPATADLWVALPNTGLSERILPLVAAMGDEVLVVGGASGWDRVATGNLRDGRVLNTTGTAWQPIPDAPVALTSGLPSAWTGTDLFLIAATGELLSFTPSSKTWTTLPRMRGNPGIGTAMAWIGGELYAMDYVGQTFTYSPTQKTWRSLESPTTIQADHSALKSVVRGSNWILSGRLLKLLGECHVHAVGSLRYRPQAQSSACSGVPANLPSGRIEFSYLSVLAR
jgi:hypothetical protein